MLQGIEWVWFGLAVLALTLILTKLNTSRGYSKGRSFFQSAIVATGIGFILLQLWVALFDS